MTTSSFSFAAFGQFMMDNPGLRFLQAGLIFFAIIDLFLLFFALRDILLRTRSFWYQFFCIVIVTVLPLLGFLIYLLIRPARTIKQRELEALLLTVVANDAPAQVMVGEVKKEVEVKDEGKKEEHKEKAEDSDHDTKHHSSPSTSDHE